MPTCGYEPTVSRPLLDLVRRDADASMAGKETGPTIRSLPDGINICSVRLARDGNRVVCA